MAPRGLDWLATMRAKPGPPMTLGNMRHNGVRSEAYPRFDMDRDGLVAIAGHRNKPGALQVFGAAGAGPPSIQRRLSAPRLATPEARGFFVSRPRGRTTPSLSRRQRQNHVAVGFARPASAIELRQRPVIEPYPDRTIWRPFRLNGDGAQGHGRCNRCEGRRRDQDFDHAADMGAAFSSCQRDCDH
jgi:hypothetical protein